MEPALIFLLSLAGIILLGVIVNSAENRLPLKTTVSPGQTYPNNHHVPGVGFYHAGGSRWCALPWNLYEEERGYYWDGEWHAEPDRREITASEPSMEEITRVNEAWRNAGPVRSSGFWSDVERFGFGTAMNRREGS